MAGSRSVHLYGPDPCFADGHGVHVGIDIRLDDADAVKFPQPFNEADEQGGLAASGRGHDVEVEYPPFLKLLPDHCRLGVVSRGDIFLYFHRSHGSFLTEHGASSAFLRLYVGLNSILPYSVIYIILLCCAPSNTLIMRKSTSSFLNVDIPPYFLCPFGFC